MADPRARMLAERLSRMMQKRRLERIGEPVPDNSVPFDGLPDEDQRNWLDVAECYLDLAEHSQLTGKLRHQIDDFDRYARTLAADVEWRNQMLRAMVVEMRVEIDRLWQIVQ